MDTVRWAGYMEITNSMPPDPLLSNDWLKVWLNRLDHLEPLAARWLSHQTRDSYWKHGSICEDYSSIKVPTLLFGGQMDGYTNTVKRTFENIRCPKRAIIGPWIHCYPDIAAPKPQCGFCNEAVKWWDKWLKGVDTVIPETMIIFLQRDVEVPCQEKVNGRWITDPITGVEKLYLSEGRLGDAKSKEVVTICSREYCGQQSYCQFATSLDDLPSDQSEDDKLSCIFETLPFEAVIEYVGRPRLTLSVASDKPVANIFVRLCVVDAKRSRLIGYTGVNLNHSNNHETVTKLSPRVFKSVTLELDYIAESIAPGCKLRLALSTAFFSMFVPNPEHTTLSVDLSKSTLELPVLQSSTLFPEKIPEVSTFKPFPTIMRTPSSFSTSKDVNELGEVVIKTKSTTGEKEFSSHGLVTEKIMEHTQTVSANDPCTSKMNIMDKARW